MAVVCSGAYKYMRWVLFVRYTADMAVIFWHVCLVLPLAENVARETIGRCKNVE